MRCGIQMKNIKFSNNYFYFFLWKKLIIEHNSVEKMLVIQFQTICDKKYSKKRVIQFQNVVKKAYYKISYGKMLTMLLYKTNKWADRNYVITICPWTDSDITWLVVSTLKFSCFKGWTQRPERKTHQKVPILRAQLSDLVMTFCCKILVQNLPALHAFLLSSFSASRILCYSSCSFFLYFHALLILNKL